MLGWVAVLVGSLIMLFADLPIIDPILSIAITVFVLSKIVPNLRSALRIFLQYVPDSADLEEVERTLMAVESVMAVHDMHLWSLDGSYAVFSAHIVVESDFDWPKLERLKRTLQVKLAHVGVEHSTLEFEPVDSMCAEDDSHGHP